MTHIYNYTFQKKDTRDYIYKLQLLSGSLAISHYIVQTYITCPILDQLSLGSCVANATYVMLYIMSKGKFKLSRLQLYLCTREIDGSNISQDTGATVRGAMKAINSYSICDETIWPYIISNYDQLSPRAAFTNTYNITKFVYTAVIQDIKNITQVLSKNIPIILGIQVYSSFESTSINKTGLIPMPNTKTEQYLGGHCIVLVGYDISKQLFAFQNSWGTSWGNNGYGYLPFNYVINKTLAADLTIVSFNY